MAFLKPEYLEGEWYVVETGAGGFNVPAELLIEPPNGFSEEGLRKDLAQYVEGEVLSWERKRAVGVRLSAPGYLDCTEWALFETETEAREYLRDAERVDPDTGDAL